MRNLISWIFFCEIFFNYTKKKRFIISTVCCHSQNFTVALSSQLKTNNEDKKFIWKIKISKTFSRKLFFILFDLIKPFGSICLFEWTWPKNSNYFFFSEKLIKLWDKSEKHFLTQTIQQQNNTLFYHKNLVNFKLSLKKGLNLKLA